MGTMIDTMRNRIGFDDPERSTQRRPRESSSEKLSRALGWFSIGLGMAELLAPKKVAKLIGVRDGRPVLRAFGAREIASGVGILSRRQPAGWVWSRVGGDLMDLAVLGSALGSRRSNRGRVASAVAAVAGVTVLDALCARKLSSQQRDRPEETSVIINRPPDECYRYWRNLENLPTFMSYLESVRQMGDKRSHWVARVPPDTRIEWDAEITNEIPNERIAWRSLPNSDVCTSGSVRFDRAPGGRGTIVRVRMELESLSNKLGSSVARWIGKGPEHLVYKDLRRFKQVLETGEVITTEGQPSGRTSSTTWLDSLAQ